ncbi:hypothetical protein HWC07_gp038 [Pantoea phage vB_PagM_LIET2]|uniref:Uncharacterized protein n=1 Tax=Pantoea phage vB_PagM_LIET2 TaxID=2508071 RepID=A0A411AW44_9CAUD|nr:hypothetical protein HWC07_gp038 [Pantoea phage vB_PagM_LIET2]QAX92290.1 hypothetical protein LIET2_gp038 [Pantoea phage vB_PagM_LIET2]
MTDAESAWPPVSNGEIYCSPACGADCTKAEFELAMIRAERLCERLNAMRFGFKDWKPHVWENMGWHYEAIRDVPNPNSMMPYPDECSIDEYFDDDCNPSGYCCSIIINGQQFMHDAPEPEEALITVMNLIRGLHQQFERHFSTFRVTQ